MVLIKSISGVRGIVFEDDSSGLSSLEITQCVKQFVTWVINKNKYLKKSIRIAVGRDGRCSGEKISTLIIDILLESGVSVLDLGLTTTPSVQLAIMTENCVGGIMISASHNPKKWNGLKLLNDNGEFLSKQEGLEVFSLKVFKTIKGNHKLSIIDYKTKHIQSILDLVDVKNNQIKKQKFKIVVDGINSSGGIYVPFLLSQLGVEVVKINCISNGLFAHSPEPLPANLTQLASSVKEHNADLGIAVDPDVDRLVLVCEDGTFFGEEYTIVAIVQYILSCYPNTNVVTNLSTTRAVQDIVQNLGATHFESAVGEINVVELMKEKNAIIGGEGSGGVIFSKSHYGRDALVGIALFLSLLSTSKLSAKELKKSLPTYFMLKDKVLLGNNTSFDFPGFIKHSVNICKKDNLDYTLMDGIKIYYKCGSWMHVRSSNTEPIVRLIIESEKQKKALEIKKTLLATINNFLT